VSAADAAGPPLPKPADVTDFWRAAGPTKWFRKDAAFDREIEARFLAAHEAAAAGRLSAWEATPDGALALLLLLDQFPRNMFRDDAQTYSSDVLAREVASRAIARGADRRVEAALLEFIYMPFMHSEDLADQLRCVGLFREAGNTDNLEYAERHADIIRRFGRFPHRNRSLGRTTTADEQAFLDGGGFSG
jgi:uncharacterized protein (DUF924 family)